MLTRRIAEEFLEAGWLCRGEESEDSARFDRTATRHIPKMAAVTG